MRTAVTISLALAALAVVGGVILGPFLIWPIVVPTLAPILPRPSGVPKDAAAEYELLSGTTWRWRRVLRDGCVDWMAEKAWADVSVSTDPALCRDGSGVSYFTSSDELVYRGYWPKPDRGGGEPCPGSISQAQIASLQKLVRDASALPITAGERVVLQRVDERLAATEGEVLTTDASGWCNDLKPEDYRHPRSRRDVWVERP